MKILERFGSYKIRFISLFISISMVFPAVLQAAAFIIVIASTEEGFVYFKTDTPTRDLIAVFENRGLFNVKNFNDEIAYPHYPGNKISAKKCTKRKCSSGVTLGFGFDTGARKPFDIAEILKKAGIDEERVEFFIESAGLKGVDAYNWIKQHKKLGTLRKISKHEALKLLELEIEASVRRVEKRIEKEGLVGSLNNMQITVLVSLDYNCPCLISKNSVKNLWKLMHVAVKSQDLKNWRSVADEIQYRSGSNTDTRLQIRRNIEAENFLNASIKGYPLDV